MHYEVLDRSRTSEARSNLQYTETKNTDKRSFGFRIDLNFPKHGDWQEREEYVRNDVNGFSEQSVTAF